MTSVNVKIEKALEEDIKRHILYHPSLFGNLGHANVVFEKAITNHEVIADCLIFSELKGIIGVEIKTERDTTKRLNKQLRAYSSMCHFVWVMCHDKHVQKVEDIIKKYNHKNVGIISYTIYEGEIIAGVYEEANTSPNFEPTQVLNLLWKKELLDIARALKNGSMVTGVKTNYVKDNYLGSSMTPNMRKPQLIRWLLQTMGTRGAVDAVCDKFRLEMTDPEKVIQYHYFKKGESLNEEIESIFVKQDRR